MVQEQWRAANGLYAHGLTVRDIQAHLEDLYGLKVSPDLISRVTDAVLGEVHEWQSRALERMYPIIIFDALRVKIRDADSRMVKSEPLMRHWFEQRRIVRHWFKNNGARRTQFTWLWASPATGCARFSACG